MSEDYTITAPRTLMPGLTAMSTKRGIVVANLHYTADPEAMTPEVIARERLRLGCTLKDDGTWVDSWRWRKEMELDWQAQSGRPVFDGGALDHQRQFIGKPAYTLDWNFEPLSMSQDRFIADPPEGMAWDGGELIPAKRDAEDRVVLSQGFWRLPERKRERVLDGFLVRQAEGRVKVWLGPRSQPVGLPEHAERVVRACGIGMDVSEGVAASDSTIEVMFADNREQAAEFADNEIHPAELGRMGAAVGRYFNNALVCCVRKMHGLTTIRTMRDEAGYGYIWRDTDPNKTTEVSTDKLGWRGGEASSPYLFGKWMDALEKHEPILHSLTLVDQHRQYIYDEAGRITHQRLVNLAPPVRDRHGDLVVGVALAYRACLDLPKFRKIKPIDDAPYGSFNWRVAQAKERQSRKKVKWS